MANGYSSYAQSQSVAESMQESEAKALLRCASKLELVQRDDVPYGEYCEAVRQNQRLWTLFQISLMKPEQNLPADLSNLLKSLSLFVDKRTMRAIAEFKSQLLSVLININRQVAAGLMQQVEAQVAARGTSQGDAVAPPPAQGGRGEGINVAG